MRKETRDIWIVDDLEGEGKEFTNEAAALKYERTVALARMLGGRLYECHRCSRSDFSTAETLLDCKQITIAFNAPPPTQ
jgi:hypothetical protein